MKKKFVVIFIAFLLLFVVPAFLSANKGGEQPEEGITIGFSLWTMEFTFFQNLEKGVRDACEEFGYEYIMIDQN